MKNSCDLGSCTAISDVPTSTASSHLPHSPEASASRSLGSRPSTSSGTASPPARRTSSRLTSLNDPPCPPPQPSVRWRSTNQPSGRPIHSIDVLHCVLAVADRTCSPGANGTKGKRSSTGLSIFLFCGFGTSSSTLRPGRSQAASATQMHTRVDAILTRSPLQTGRHGVVLSAFVNPQGLANRRSALPATPPKLQSRVDAEDAGHSSDAPEWRYQSPCEA